MLGVSVHKVGCKVKVHALSDFAYNRWLLAVVLTKCCILQWLCSGLQLTVHVHIVLLCDIMLSSFASCKFFNFCAYACTTRLWKSLLVVLVEIVCCCQHCCIVKVQVICAFSLQKWHWRWLVDFYNPLLNTLYFTNTVTKLLSIGQSLNSTVWHHHN